MIQWASIVVILFRMALPALSQDYTCDYVFDSQCIMDGISDLTDWNFKAEYYSSGRITGMKFTSGLFYELSSPVSISHAMSTIYTIDLSGNQLKTVTKFDFSVNALIVANLSRNGIENLDSDSIFEAHPQLETIDLSFNLIVSINAAAFNGVPELQYLFLNDNQLTEVNEIMFAPLVQLRRLELSSNYIENFGNNLFGALVALQTLNLERNNFSEFDFNVLESNANLNELSLGDNRGSGFLSLNGTINSTTSMKFDKIIMSNITAHGRFMSIKDSQLSVLTISSVVETLVAANSSITELVFSDQESSLTVGDFSRNLLTGQLALEHCEKLKVLDLSSNQIEGVRLGNSSLMTSLNLSHNNLTLIPNMTTLINLIVLDISFNCIENFAVNTFSNMISLEVLNLRQTCFKALQYGTFTSQTRLRVLDISFNNLNSIELELLSGQAVLEDLFIDGNNLTNIELMDSIDDYFSNLQSMGLTHNNWSCKTLSSLLNKLHRSNVNVFVGESIKNTTNIKGIGCTTFNRSHKTLIVPETPMLINHTMYMSKIEKINEIVKSVNELTDKQNDREMLANAIKDLQRDKVAMKSDFDDRIKQFKSFGREIVDKFESLNEINFKKLMQMKATIDRLNGTNNRQYALISESITSLKDRLILMNWTH